jgi:hypothetical protein
MVPKTVQEIQRRAELIGAIQTPLAFYALIALVADDGFASAAVLNSWSVEITVSGMVLLLLALVAIVTYHAY